MSLFEELLGGLNVQRQDNRNALMMAGAGLLSGNNWQSGFSNMAQGAIAGRQMDALASDKRAKVAQRNKSVDFAMNNWGMSQPEAEAMIAEGGFWNEMKSRRAQEQQTQKTNRTVQTMMGMHPDMSEDQAQGIIASGQAGEWLKPQKPQKLPSSVQEFEYGEKNPAFREHLIEQKKAGATKVSFNEGQGKAAGFADRMLAAEQIIQEVELAGLNKKDATLSQLPGGNMMISEDYQRLQQAKRDFATAILRLESGAVIGADEMADIDQKYFPQIGDSEEVIAQKRRSRLIAINGVQRSAGPSYQAPELPQTTKSASQPQQPANVVDYSEYFK